MDWASDPCAMVCAFAMASNISAAVPPAATASVIMALTAAIPLAEALATALNLVSAVPLSPALEADEFRIAKSVLESDSAAKPPLPRAASFAAIDAAMVELSALASPPLAPAKALPPAPIKFATSTPAAFTWSATAAKSGSSALATGSKFSKSKSTGRPNASRIALKASAWVFPLATSDATRVVSGVMVVEPTGPFKILVYASPVDKSVPPNITIGASL